MTPLEQIKAWLLQQKHEREVSCMSESSFALRMFNQDQLKDEIIEKMAEGLDKFSWDSEHQWVVRLLGEVAEMVRKK